jgi:hypothetical protein
MELQSRTELGCTPGSPPDRIAQDYSDLLVGVLVRQAAAVGRFSCGCVVYCLHCT